VHGPKTQSKDPSPLEIKEVRVGSPRYVVCRNADQANKDREDRQAMVAHLRYQELWRVEQIFRTIQSSLENRPLDHKVDATIRGHVFCSFLALVLLKELQARLEQTP